MNGSLPIGEILVAARTISAAELEQALAYQREHGGRLGAILVKMGALSEDTLLPVLAEQTGYPLVVASDIPESAIATALAHLGRDVAWLTTLESLAWMDEDGALHVASGDPLNSNLNDAVAAASLHRPVAWHFMRPAEVEKVLLFLQSAGRDRTLDANRLREMAEDAPVISFVNNLISQAIDERASDIHVEPGERECEILFRIDGVLHLRQSLPMTRYPAISSRIKLIAHLDIAERRLPQDGRISLRAAGTELDLRVSSIPAVHGESLVLRLLPKDRGALTLQTLGLVADQLSLLREWLKIGHGVVLVTGPTGSGKSTTLYSALAAINDRSQKIVTVEDPVEFRLPQIVQIQVQAEIGYTFARALRSILRHDPDIVMIGEIRDGETAGIAMQAALTGHLVLATLHTNDALSAFTRLVDMGVEPYLVAAAARAVIAQRLIRRLCLHCAREITPSPAVARAWGELAPRLPPSVAVAHPRWMEAVGCGECQHTGYQGRLGIYEMVNVTPEIQQAITIGAPLRDLEVLADAGGRRRLRADGLLRAAQGLTTVDEVLRTTYAVTVAAEDEDAFV